jgi:hypothetical protein
LISRLKFQRKIIGWVDFGNSTTLSTAEVVLVDQSKSIFNSSNFLEPQQIMLNLLLLISP